MTHENFNALVDKLEASRVSILKERNAKYSHPDNAPKTQITAIQRLISQNILSISLVK